MEPFKPVKSIPTPLDKVNVDTDQIVPKQFLKLVQKTGFGKHLFFDWRYDKNEKPRSDFILNNPQYRGSKILLTRENFGCGSSREHATIALSQSGIKAVLAVSFARIFYRNAVDGAFLLPIEIDENAYKNISDKDELEINTEKNKINNLTKEQVYSMKPFPELIKKIIDAGGLFNYKP